MTTEEHLSWGCGCATFVASWLTIAAIVLAIVRWALYA
jgi:hypothetical protein